MTFIHSVLFGQNSVTQCHLMQRRLGNVVQLGGQEKEEMGLVNILPVSTTISYCIGSKSYIFCLHNISKFFLFFSISNITSFIFYAFIISYNASFSPSS